MDHQRQIVGISPPAELQRRARLCSALEAAYPVRFVARQSGEWRELDGAVLIGDCASTPTEIPWLRMAGEESSQAGEAREVALSDSELLAPPLRSARLTDRHALSPAGAIGEGTLLAALDGVPAWTALSGGGAEGRQVACVPAELGEREGLRERLQAGRCLALLALAHFLGDLVGVPRDAPTHACFLIDDPNLHWPSYGHIHYGRLLEDARRHGYHVAIAMTPLDGWLAHPGAVRLFRDGALNLSICIHGNDHDGPELARHDSAAANLALARQALERSRSFERRTGLSVDRVMVPPHERISETAARALREAGFQAICTTRPYPWVASSAEVSWLGDRWRRARSPAGGRSSSSRAGCRCCFGPISSIRARTMSCVLSSGSRRSSTGTTICSPMAWRCSARPLRS